MSLLGTKLTDLTVGQAIFLLVLYSFGAVLVSAVVAAIAALARRRK